jgi:hypothetical protein
MLEPNVLSSFPMLPFDFLADPTKDNVRALTWLWLGLFFLLMLVQWRSPRSVGLPLTYALSFGMIHVIGSWPYCFDFYTPRSAALVQGGNSLKFSHLGLWMSTLGFACFVLGVAISRFLPRKEPPQRSFALPPQLTSQLPGTLLLFSLAFFFVIGPVLRRVPSFGSLGVGGAFLSVIAIFLFCFRAYDQQRWQQFVGWLSSTLMFPLLTVVSMGFIGYGVAAASAVWMLVLNFAKPRLLALLVFVCLVTAGMTLYINWVISRESIRESVWGGRSISARVDQVFFMIKYFEVFDPTQQNHLELVEMRLNQNDLVGKAILHTGNNEAFANGRTFWVALLAPIPRILWPGKPVFGGSAGVVQKHTGQKFADGTSVGAGQVLEFYINFGTYSVVIGFFLFGLVMGGLDLRAGSYLKQGDYWNMTRWLLPGIGMLQPGGLLGEVVGSVAVNTVLVQLLHHFFFAQYYQIANLPALQAAQRRGSKVPR